MSDINVTPFVDVMLVLLIIFMVTAPLMTVGVPVDLPKTKAGPLSEKTEPLVISITVDGKIHLQETELELEGLVDKLRAILQGKPETKVYVRGDKDVPYGRVVEVMGTLNTSGFSKVALMAEMPKHAPEIPAVAGHSATPLKHKKSKLAPKTA